MTDHQIRVAIIDDQALSRLGISLVIDSQPDMAVVGEAADGATGLELIRQILPDVVLMDIRMPGLDGIAATRHAVERDPDAKILVLTTFDLDDYAFAALEAGASGFLSKSTDPVTLAGAIRSVAAGDAVLSPAATRSLLRRLAAQGARPAAHDPTQRLAHLTARETEVLTAVGQGLTNAEIAATLVVSVETVKTHVKRILAKAGLRDRVQAVILAYDCGLVRPTAPTTPAGNTPPTTALPPRPER